MFLVDAQVHCWGPNTSTQPWLEDRVPYAHALALGPDKISQAMETAGVTRAILIPPSWIGDDNTAVLCAARANPQRFAVMGRFNPDMPDARYRLKQCLAQPAMLGIRLTFHQPAWRYRLTDGSLDWFWAAMEEENMPVMVYAPGQISSLKPIVAKHPGLSFIIDHMGCLGGAKNSKAFAQIGQILALSRYHNVAIKVTSLPSYTTEGYPFKNIHHYIQQVYERFGPQRMLWGSDYSRLPVPYSECIRLFTEGLSFLSRDDLVWIMGKTTCTWLKWDSDS